MSFELTKKEIVKEILKSGKDPVYFIDNYARISHPLEGLIPFKLYPFQQELLRDFNDHRFNVILKARQLGISTTTAAYVAWMMLFHRNKNILVIATKFQTAGNLVKKVKGIMRNVPDWLSIATITVDNRTAKLYVDGTLVGTHNKIDTEFNRLKVGLNRYGQQPWKGYADELMIFGDALTDDEMMSIYKNTLPGTPENITAINWTGDTVVVGWDALDGTNEYRVYYSTDDTVGENSPYITVTGGTVVNFDNLTQGQDYTYAVAGVSPLGVGELSATATITLDSAEPVYVD